MSRLRDHAHQSVADLPRRRLGGSCQESGGGQRVLRYENGEIPLEHLDGQLRKIREQYQIGNLYLVCSLVGERRRTIIVKNLFFAQAIGTKHKIKIAPDSCVCGSTL